MYGVGSTNPAPLHPSNRGKGMRNNKELLTVKTTVMTKNKPEYLKIYKEWMERGKMPKDGLCLYFGKYHKLLRLFRPTDEDFEELYRLGLPGVYWGRESFYYKRDDFTPLRQTIVLFMAAMNNEL